MSSAHTFILWRPIETLAFTGMPDMSCSIAKGSSVRTCCGWRRGRDMHCAERIAALRRSSRPQAAATSSSRGCLSARRPACSQAVAAAAATGPRLSGFTSKCPQRIEHRSSETQRQRTRVCHADGKALDAAGNRHPAALLQSHCRAHVLRARARARRNEQRVRLRERVLQPVQSTPDGSCPGGRASSWRTRAPRCSATGGRRRRFRRGLRGRATASRSRAPATARGSG